MIDIHSHVLPYVDDGSKSLEASLLMIKNASDQGVSDIFLTPHFMRFRNYLSSFDKNFEEFQKLKLEVLERGYTINLHLGNEIYYTIDTIRNLKSKIAIPMGKSNKVLIEFSMSEEDEDIIEAIHNLKSAGYIPIIAHPERYLYIKKISDYELMKKMGALIQINAPSIIGKYGTSIQKLSMKLIKMDLVDFVGSDVHEFRAYNLLAAYNLVKDKFDIEKANRIFNNTSILN
jgi:protein-tyrosine phosphatase